MSAEALLDWIGSAKKDLLAFPEPVIHAMGYAQADIALIGARLKLARADHARRFKSK